MNKSGMDKNGNSTRRQPEARPFAFITSSSLSDPAARKQIRSHVMRGKNRKRPAREDADPVGSWINSSRSQTPPGERIPRSICHDLALVPFPQAMQPAMFQLVFQFLTAIKQSLYPVEVCVDFDLSKSQWLAYLVEDKAYLHACLFTSQGISDYARNVKPGATTLAYHSRSLQLLRQNLTQNETATSNSTLAAVVSLALVSEQLGELEEARNHTQGLYRLVSLRGGIETLAENYQLQIKVCRADLGLALRTGNKPLFFTDNLCWKPYIAPPDKKPNNTILHKLHRSSSSGSPDPRLVNVWLDLCEFSRSANIAYQTGRRIRGEVFQEAIVSVQYRLLALEHEQRDKQELGELESVPIEETMVRLGMLAFCATAFLQPKGVRPNHPRFATRMKECLELAIPASQISSQRQTSPESDMEMETTKIFWRLKLWLLYISHISVLPGNEHGDLVVSTVADVLSVLGLTSWKEVRDVLMEHVWIDWIDGPAGMDLTERALALQ